MKLKASFDWFYIQKISLSKETWIKLKTILNFSWIFRILESSNKIILRKKYFFPLKVSICGKIFQQTSSVTFGMILNGIIFLCFCGTIRSNDLLVPDQFTILGQQQIKEDYWSNEIINLFILCIFDKIIAVHAQVPYFLRNDIFCFSKLKVFSNRLLLV